MFTTGSKTLLGSTTIAIGLAVAYGVLKGGALGTFGLIAAAVGLMMLSIAFISVRDATVSAMDHQAVESSAASKTSVRRTLWPLLTAAGVVLTAFGLVSNIAFVLVGVVLIFAGLAEWMVQSWSEHVSSDPNYNEMARLQLADPLEVPVAGALLAGVVAFGFSRVMLGLPSKTATIIAFVIVAALILALGAWVGTRHSIGRNVVVGSFSVVVLVLGLVGFAFGVSGEREVHEHETTTDLAHEDKCGPEDTHADEKINQTLSDKSSVTANVVFDGSKLVAEIPGFDTPADNLTLIRSNYNHIVFHNDGDEPARLVIDLHPAAADLEGDNPPPERICSALAEPGGVQFLSVYFARNTMGVEAEYGTGYAFEVPGSDATMEVTVP